MKQLEWNVVVFDHNKRDFVIRNILTEPFINEIKERTMCLQTKQEFSERVRSICMYRFWRRWEWELVLKELTSGKDPKEMKVDAYWQIKVNLDRFIDYLWNNLRGDCDAAN